MLSSVWKYSFALFFNACLSVLSLSSSWMRNSWSCFITSQRTDCFVLFIFDRRPAQMKVLSIERRELSESGENWRNYDTWRFIFKSIDEYFKTILENNTKLNKALVKRRSKFLKSTFRHCIFQHLDKSAFFLLIYYLFYFSELSEWSKPIYLHELCVAKYSVNCKLN